MHAAARVAVSDGIHAMAIGATILGLIAFVLAWFIREVPLRDRMPAEPATTAA
ncbi:hypothetical protein NE236_07945 [Actinoallomurus purpureus]|uniref:hypothetical protein n=1 Tax=Actinoallomurus purpureus TaxID=478114 RepID=UPI0020927559|nr:hypothetical protein [Actinoallomurus purpureus]MCO6004910.1 hypothetical protein [Actinoallomurus purpureus]